MKTVDTQLQQKFKRNLGVFFSNNTSLEEWYKNGFLNREVNYYKKLSKQNIRVTLFTYGNKKDLKFKKKLNPIRIIPLYSKFYFPNITFLKSIFQILHFIKSKMLDISYM